MRLAADTRLGPYRIVAPLGAGGMGEVYRARDSRLERDVALKVLPELVASHPDRLARFEREAKTVAALNHPNIVTLHSIEDAGGVRFLTMELVEGQSLDRLVTPDGLPLARVLEISIPLADALAAAHDKGIVHRDLKSGNVMVTHEGRVKVLDFGLAKPAELESTSDDTQALTVESPVSMAGQVVGTVPYMAPEQVRGEVLDARTDLFALGVILYELATGRRPFQGPTAADVSSAILRDPPVPLQSARADLPRDLDRIVGRCLEKDRERRFQTAKDVRNELELVRREVESGVASSSRSPAVPASSIPPKDVLSIAVLPFVNRSRDEEDEYFSDGLADELLNVLARIRGLRVAARTSSFTFKGKQATIADVGSALHVANVLEGSVRKVGNRVRIAVQLVKVSDGYQLWSETYDRTLEDIFAVQDGIAQSVVKELRATLLGGAPDSQSSRGVSAEVAAAVKGRGQNAEGHRLYLQGRCFLDRSTREDVAKGIRYLRQALELDPGHALAWEGLSRAYAIEANAIWVPPAEGFARAREAAEHALALEPDLADGHAARGRIQMLHDWDWKSAEASFRRALELAPGNATALRGAATLAVILGRLEEAIHLYRLAVEHDPLSTATYNNLGFAYRAAGLLLQAEEAYRKALDLMPHRNATRAAFAVVLLDRGREEEALAEAERESDEALRLWALALIHEDGRRRTESDEALRQLIEEYSEDSAFQIAQVFAARGEADRVFGWLERAYAQRDIGLANVKPEPRFRSLHDDRRWTGFLRRMGLAE